MGHRGSAGLGGSSSCQQANRTPRRICERGDLASSVHWFGDMKPCARLGSLSLAFAAALGACTIGEDPEVMDDDEYDETVHLDHADGEDGEGKSDAIRTSPVCVDDGRLSLSECALLGTIAYAEGTGPHYNYIYGYRKFSSYADHPRIRVCAGGWCSTAAGRYQILAKTWSGIRSGLSDFSPANQDIAGLRLIKGRGVYDVPGIDTYSEFAAVMRKLNREWASLPGSPYGQPTHSTQKLWGEFKRLHGQL